MEIARTLPALRQVCDRTRRPLALVPTMGALHRGHVALIEAAHREGATVAASLFVNPTQFGANEDFSRYPRDEAADLSTFEKAGCAIVWVPDVTTMYAEGDATTITVGGPAEGFEGAMRPGHFRGVATVVAKLFGQVRPDIAYFGEKDWQQLQVIRRMVANLHLPVQVEGVPTIREADGLALSSRNRYLSAGDRARAPALYAALCTARDALRGDADVAQALGAGRRSLADAGFTVDYFDLVEAETLAPPRGRGEALRLIAAARLGTTRLLDNIAI